MDVEIRRYLLTSTRNNGNNQQPRVRNRSRYFGLPELFEWSCLQAPENSLSSIEDGSYDCQSIDDPLGPAVGIVDQGEQEEANRDLDGPERDVGQQYRNLAQPFDRARLLAAKEL